MNRRRFTLGAGCAAAGLATRTAYGQTFNALAGDAFLLDGAEARLADILSPRMADPPGKAEPFADFAKAALARLLAARRFIYEDAAPEDRWGRRVVHARAEDAGPSLQEALVAAGAARVRPESGETQLIDALLAAEAEARQARRGLWQATVYSVRDARAAEDAVGFFALVEGAVVSAYAGRGRVYLNFGEDYRRDFTLTAPSRMARRWAKEGLDLATLAGARLRARGYVAWINGPSIEATHRQAIELIETAAPTTIPPHED